jgi:hypothetical protein
MVPFAQAAGAGTVPVSAEATPIVFVFVVDDEVVHRPQ